MRVSLRRIVIRLVFVLEKLQVVSTVNDFSDGDRLYSSLKQYWIDNIDTLGEQKGNMYV